MGYATIGTYLPITSNTPRHADQILLAADEKWREEERWNLYETSNLGIPETLPMTSKAAAARSFDPDLVNIGTSVVVPYTEEVITKTETVKLTVTPEELAMLRKDVTFPFTDRQAFGPHVTQVEVISLPKVRAPRAEATDGKAVTKYVVISAGRELASADTQAEARQKAIEMMKANERISKLSVEARVTREDGNAALVTISRPVPDESVVTFKVTKVVPKPGAALAGYYVAFSVHS